MLVSKGMFSGHGIQIWGLKTDMNIDGYHKSKVAGMMPIKIQTSHIFLSRAVRNSCQMAFWIWNLTNEYI